MEIIPGERDNLKGSFYQGLKQLCVSVYLIQLTDSRLLKLWLRELKDQLIILMKPSGKVCANCG
ncbi:MAG: hypothetical protein Ct9H300mP28_34820 [Pseudomonadota bacterium]|nr:MAG: hypothetical protein Ct9H300mP28_34820 [Pseudomonadota bacterium]